MTDPNAYRTSALSAADSALVRKVLVSEKDVLAFENALRAVRTGRALALVGAGFSARVDYPSWEELVSQLAGEARAQSAQSSSSRGAAVRHLNPAIDQFEDILWRAEEYRTAMREDRFGAFLSNKFGSNTKSDVCIDAVVQLPFQHVLTTNYETSLERAHITHRPSDEVNIVNWDDDAAVLRLMYALVDDAPERRYVYLHGRIDAMSTHPASSVILTDRDYTRRYLRDDRTVRKLFAIFAMRRVCFFGFSLTDPDLSAILRQVAGALGYEQARHFAFIGVRTEEEKEIHRKRLRNKFGIEGIFYTKENRHARLEQLMRLLMRGCGLTVTDPPVSPSGPGAAAPTETTPAITGSQATTASPQVGDTQVGSTGEQRLVNKEDPNKGQFGGTPTRNGRVLRCSTPTPSDVPGWFVFTLTVGPDGAAPPVQGPVVFHLHDTFSPNVIPVDPVGGGATLDLTSYGAFTVGAILADGTKLELDLASLAEAPQEFRAN